MNVKMLCLGALTLGDATGYEIRKYFEDGPFAQFYDASYGSIYPALAALLADGLVSVTEVRQEGKPEKKVYSLTNAGLEVFREALREPPGRDKIRSETIVRLFFAELMNQEDLERVFDAYVAGFRALSDNIRALDDEGVKDGRLFVRGLGLRFYDSIADYLEENRENFFAKLAASDETDKSKVA